MRVPVIINNYNLLTWPKEMVNRLKQWENIGEIIIVDNASDYEPLLEWYDTSPCTVIRLESNMGHKAPWDSGVVSGLGTSVYAITDPDLDLSSTSKKTINKCLKALYEFKGVGKVGLRLEYKDVPEASSYYEHIQSYERNRQINTRIVNGVLIDVSIDTTFAVYDVPNYFIGGVSLPESARHIPWYYSKEERESDAEFSQYIKSATSASSYKTFLNL